MALIVARSRNGVIGRDGHLPWRLPSEMAFFKARTLGKPIVMGRKTWDSLGRPLPGRTSFVLTRRRDCAHEGVVFMDDFDALLAAAQARALADGPGADGLCEVMVIGGSGVYELALARTSRAYLTEVEVELEGDAYFTALDEADWVETWSQGSIAQPGDDHAYRIRILERRR